MPGCSASPFIVKVFPEDVCPYARTDAELAANCTIKTLQAVLYEGIADLLEDRIIG